MTDNIGKYTLIEKLGQGGFATVHKATDPDLGRLVAIQNSTRPFGG